MVVALVKENKQEEMFTDLTEVELAKFTGKEPVNVDDVGENPILPLAIFNTLLRESIFIKIKLP